MAKAAGPSKRGPEDQGDREHVRRTPSPVEAEQMDDALIRLGLERKKALKRMAQEEAKDE